uniref:Uncharacterized protein n=1 Tax=Anguilla anguilla TaxID=7936 RepID=A0A0E9Y2H2_ANGAN
MLSAWTAITMPNNMFSTPIIICTVPSAFVSPFRNFPNTEKTCGVGPKAGTVGPHC